MPSRRTALTACIASILLVSPVGADEDGGKGQYDPPTISVTGTGKISATPDVAEINVGVVTQGGSASGALATNNEAVAALMDVLKSRGIAAKDIQTANISINPRYSQPVPGRPEQPAREFVPRIVGYEVTNTVTVTSRKIDKLGEVLDSVVTAGANQMHGISFRIDEPDKLLDQARKDALADARRKAELLAGEAGVVLGAPLLIQEGGDVRPPQPLMYGAMRAAMAEAVPVAPGEQELSVTLQVVYRIEPAK